MERAKAVWNNYGTDRAYVLRMLGLSAFECDNYSHCDWESLPDKIKTSIRSGTMNKKAEIHNALTLAKKAIAKVVLHGPNYDWNADPLSLTLITGEASQAIDRALELVAPDLGTLADKQSPR